MGICIGVGFFEVFFFGMFSLRLVRDKLVVTCCLWWRGCLVVFAWKLVMLGYVLCFVMVVGFFFLLYGVVGVVFLLF